MRPIDARRTGAARARGFVTGVAASALLLVSVPHASGIPRPADYRILSTSSGGTLANSYSYEGDISADGRWVTFASNASNLVDGDTNDEIDVFVKDTQTGDIERINLGPDGSQGERGLPAGDPRISADGRFVSYTSLAANLVPDDTNDIWDIFVYDRVERRTERVSVSTDGAQASGTNSGSAISADGRYVAFTSSAELVDDDTNGWSDIYVRDRVLGTTERVSVSSSGAQTSLPGALTPSISADGRRVTFRTSAPELVDGDLNRTWDIFVHDRTTRETRLVSVAADGTMANDQSNCATISGDGRHVAFTSAASNLVPADGNRSFDVFVKDLETGEVDRVLLTHAGEEVSGDYRWYSCEPDISFDGRFVFFHTLSQGVEPDADTGEMNLFAHDRLSGLTERIAVAADGGPLNDSATAPNVTPDGRFVTFVASASNIVAGDDNAETDLYLLDRGPAVGARRLSMTPEGAHLRVSTALSFASAVVDEAEDAAGDGLSGIDLTSARIVFRPERRDLAVVWEVDALPAVRGVNVPGPMPVPGSPGVSAPPGLSFDLRFVAGGIAYRVVAHRAPTAPVAPTFELQRCAAGTCETIAELAGGYGTGGDRVMTVIPMDAVSLAEGDEVSSVEASVTAEGVGMMDQVSLATASIPARSAELVLEADAQSVSFPIEVGDGEVDELVDWSQLPPGPVHATLVTCIGEDCATHAHTVVK